MLGEIVLPAGTKTVTVREIPSLIATAIYPEIQGDCPLVISYLNKLEPDGGNTAPARRSEPLTDNDWDTLNAIWQHLPPYRESMTDSEWVPYAEAFENSRHKPNWTVIPIWLNERLNRDILRLDAENQHLDLLKAAVIRGAVTPLNHALVPVPMAAGEMLMNAVLTVADFAQYAGGYHIGVRTQMVNDLPEIWAQQSKEKQDAGRYTLGEAAAAIAEGAGERQEKILKKLIQSVKSGKLPVYAPGENIRYQSDTVRDFYEEAYWNDLNQWLAENEPRISWRFPMPEGMQVEKSSSESIGQPGPIEGNAVNEIRSRKPTPEIYDGWQKLMEELAASPKYQGKNPTREKLAQVLHETKAIRASPSTIARRTRKTW